jgi:hypothetical protein
MRRLMKATTGAAAVLVVLGPAGPAPANDSSAQLATGGLVLTKTDAIEMRTENLSISDKLVHVHYVFANTSGHDVTELVAFPLPDITVEGVDDNISIPTQSPTNFLGFETVVDGKRVNAQVEQKAFKNGVDETAFLRGLAVPLAPQLQSTDDAITHLPPAAQKQLIGKGMAYDDTYDAGKGLEHHLTALWTLKTTYYWQQTFPAARTVVVDHTYQPSVGGSAGTAWGDPTYVSEQDYSSGRALYCIDDDFLAAARARYAAAQAGKATDYAEERIRYVLVTGANWKAPIGDFTMTIDKGATNRLVSFCGDGVKKIGPTQFQVHYTNFTPTKDVAILILIPQGP